MADHNILTEEPKLSNCTVCDGTNYTSVDGFYYCDECGAQAKDNQELEHEINYNVDQKLTHTSTIQIQSRVRLNEAEITTWEEYNFILFGLVNELMDIGAKEELKMTVLQMWTAYLRVNEVAFMSKIDPKLPKLGAYFKHKDGEIIYKLKRKRRKKMKSKSNATSLTSEASSSMPSEVSKRTLRLKLKKQQKNLAKAEYKLYQKELESNISISNISGSSSRASKSEASSVSIEYSRLAKKTLKKIVQKKHIRKHEEDATIECHDFTRTSIKKKQCNPEYLGRSLLFEILYLALNHINDDIQLGDIIRYIKEGHLSFYNVDKFFPDNVNRKKLANNFSHSQSVIPSHKYVRHSAARLSQLLHVQVAQPDLFKLCKRYVKELCLPMDIYKIVETLLIVSPPDLEIRGKNFSIPNYEGRAIAYVIFAMKLLFGLDDEREEHMSSDSIKINEVIDKSDPNKKKIFVFSEWLKFIEMRNIILQQCHYATAMNSEPNPNYSSRLYVEHMKRLYQKNQLTVTEENEGLSRTTQINMHLIFSQLAEKYRTEEDQEIISHNFQASLTPLKSYLAILQKDRVATANILIPSFMYECHEDRDIRPYLKPSTLRAYFKSKQSLRLNINRIGFNQNILYVEPYTPTYPKKASKTSDNKLYFYNTDFDENEWTEDLNEAEEQLLKLEQNELNETEDTVLENLKMIKISNAIANENKLRLQNQQENDQQAKNDDLTPRALNDNVRIFDYIPSDDEGETEVEELVDDLYFSCSNFDYWMYSGTVNVQNFQFDDIERHMPKNFLWMVDQCAAVTECRRRDVYSELIVIENWFGYVLDDFSKMTDKLVYKNSYKNQKTKNIVQTLAKLF